ncbi:MAG: septal ring lytic transglycosylase RlpA family protein [Alphaproteobacteria bacterium]|nr:septal ring lytic transglycosylase RlpA family protein [Alphaproteobacteria bacterium]
MHRYFRLILVLGAVLATQTACTTTELASHMLKRMFRDNEHNLPKEVKVGNPYKVDGQWYTPSYDPDYDENGLASWYGPGFHGKYTANGEVYDQEDITAAHKTLPLPSLVRVTNRENGRSLIVRVNDRGPFVDDRIIDLSHRSAELLGIVGTGTAKVNVEYLDKETKEHWASLGIAPGKDVDTTTYAASTASPVMSSDLTPSSPPEPMGLIARNAPAFEQGASDTGGAGIQVADLSATTISSAVASDAARSAEDMEKEMHTHGWIDTNAVNYTDTSGGEPQPLVAPAAAPAAVPVAMASDSGTLSRPEAAPARADDGVFVQAGAFGVRQNADKAVDQLAGLGGAEIIPVEVAAKTLYRVRVGPLQTHTDAEAIRTEMVSLGFPGARIVSN